MRNTHPQTQDTSKRTSPSAEETGESESSDRCAACRCNAASC